jgi:ubiquinone/menaquinone biosynthesis C-methylase UbiE
MKRVVTPELLDTDQGTPEEVAASLEDLRWLNRYFGGVSTTTKLLFHVADATGLKQISFLDVAGASGDVASAAHDQLRTRGVDLNTTVLDRSATHLPPSHPRNGNGTNAVVGDALDIPFRDGSFDVVGSSLFLHHLEPDQIVRFINEALRVCRYAVIVNDLRRDPIHLATAYAGAAIYRSRITRNDAPASVRGAYTPEEMRGILQRTKAGNVEFSRHYFFRMGIVIWPKSHPNAKVVHND